MSAYNTTTPNASADAQGNTAKQTGSYTTTGGATRDINDVWFAFGTLINKLKTTPTAANQSYWSLSA